MKKKMKNKTAIDRTRKEGREQTNYRRNKRGSSRTHCLLTETSEISVLHFPPHIFFFFFLDFFFLNIRDDSFDPDAACCWWCGRDQQNLPSKTCVSCCYRRGLNLLGLLNPQQVGVRAAGGSSVSLSSNLCTSAYRTVNLISAVTLKQSVSGFNNQHTALSFSHFPCLLWVELLVSVSPVGPPARSSPLGTEGLGWWWSWPCLLLATWMCDAIGSHREVLWVTLAALTRPPPVTWRSSEERGEVRAGCWWELCPSLDGVDEMEGLSWVLFLVVFFSAAPLQGAHRLLHTVV